MSNKILQLTINFLVSISHSGNNNPISSKLISTINSGKSINPAQQLKASESVQLVNSVVNGNEKSLIANEIDNYGNIDYVKSVNYNGIHSPTGGNYNSLIGGGGSVLTPPQGGGGPVSSTSSSANQLYSGDILIIDDDFSDLVKIVNNFNDKSTTKLEFKNVRSSLSSSSTKRPSSKSSLRSRKFGLNPSLAQLLSIDIR